MRSTRLGLGIVVVIKGESLVGLVVGPGRLGGRLGERMHWRLVRALFMTTREVGGVVNEYVRGY